MGLDIKGEIGKVTVSTSWVGHIQH
jgi:hypothetical protein